MNLTLIYALAGSLTMVGLCALSMTLLAPNASMKAVKQDAMSPIEIMVGFLVVLMAGLIYSAHPLLATLLN